MPKNYSTLIPNCEVVEKHWENPLSVRYFFNSKGRRDGQIPSSYEKPYYKRASIGDSFTFGAMVPINQNYNYLAFKKIENKSFLVHNYGVAGESLKNIVNKLNDLDFEKYDFILYGLTPNDFFDYLTLSDDSNEGLSRGNMINDLKFFYSLRTFLLSTAISKYILQQTLLNDEMYYKIYKNRKPYSGYLEKKLDEKWITAIEIFRNDFENLPENIRNKLKIILLPQKAETVYKRLDKYNDTYVKKF